MKMQTSKKLYKINFEYPKETFKFNSIKKSYKDLIIIKEVKFY